MPSGSGRQAIEVRRAAIDDCEAIAALEAPTFGRSDPETLRRQCVSQIANPDRLVVVATLGNRIVGFGRVRLNRREPGSPSAELPAGWFLAGVAVSERWRRRGIGRSLTRHRLQWIAERAEGAYYFTDAENTASIALHRSLGFVEISRSVTAPGIEFTGGAGTLFHVDLAAWQHPAAPTDG